MQAVAVVCRPATVSVVEPAARAMGLQQKSAVAQQVITSVKMYINELRHSPAVVIVDC